MASGSSSSEANILKFVRWSSRVDDEFWHRFAALKLDTLKLEEKPVDIHGFFAPSSHSQIPSHLQLHFESFPQQHSPQSSDSQLGHRNRCPVPGTLYSTNTEESFLAIDKNALLKTETQKIWNDICSGRAEEDCRLLNRFFVISYGDLKKWRFYYWFCSPGIVLNPAAISNTVQPASEVFKPEEAENVLKACNSWRNSAASTCLPFFLLHDTDGSGTAFRARPLRDWTECQKGGKVLLAFYDPCNLQLNPGWPLRNLVALASSSWRVKDVQVLCYRENRGQADLRQCLILHIKLPEPLGQRGSDVVPEAVGWEYNTRGKMGPRMVDLASSMDPVRMAISAADLNLKLMRWRLLPSLNMALLAETKCLLLGAGTLGCQVARNLMAWGFRHITLIDYGHVAMSNPLRQSLYAFEDCLEGGKSKAEAAAENLRKIFPGVESRGIQLAIPMPGHKVSDREVSKVRNDCDLLKTLVEEYDVIFLLTDTRESRWLPTLLCANANKIAITAALGFDTFLVMRHGAGPSLSCSQLRNEIKQPSTMLEEVGKISDQRLGCYFCNDVVAPNDSTTNRTLDQQCTVTRPGVASIAAALAVELTINLLHHPLKINAAADTAFSQTALTNQPLGILPHQVRGFVADFSQSVFVGNAFNKCSACSLTVVSEFQQGGFDFLLKVFNHPTFLEDLTGLTDLLKATDEISIDWEEDETDYAFQGDPST